MTSTLDYLRRARYTALDRVDDYCYTHLWVPTIARKWSTWLLYRFGDSFGPMPTAPLVRVPCRWEGDVPVEWLHFSNTHTESETCLRGCVIHNRTAHHMQFWTLHWRADRGIFERLCPEHGCGHPDPDQGPYWESTGQDWQWVHGCCGCCASPQPPMKGGDDD